MIVELLQQKIREKVNNLAFAYEEKCPNCGSSYEGYNGGYIYNDEFKCPSCIIDFSNHKLPHFVEHIPPWTSGFDTHIYDFITIEGLAKKFRLGKHDILVYQGSQLMTQNISKSFWWVLGNVYNFDLVKVNLPLWNPDIYDENKIPIDTKVQQWLKDKLIIHGEVE